MNYLIQPFMGEIRKQMQLFKYSPSNVFQSLIWPLLSFCLIFLTYKNFDITYLSKYGVNNTNQLLVFLITGTVAFNCNWIMVINALKIRYERENGTLEEIFFSPSVKLAIVYGRSMGYFLQFCWLYVSLMIPCSLLYQLSWLKMIQLNFLLLFITLISSVVWGGFITSLFIITRDSSFIFPLFNLPTQLFAGVSVPIESLPKIIYPVSFFFPLTYNLKMIRLVLNGSKINLSEIFSYVLVLVFLIMMTIYLLNVATKRNRDSGNYSLY